MIKKGWNRLFGGEEGSLQSAAAPAMAPVPSRPELREFSRQSSALDQFFQAFHGQVGLMVLDLGVSNQENTDFFNELGHKLRYDNFVRSLDESFGDGDFYANQDDEDRIETFQSKVLNFDDDSLDGVLVWDSLQYLSPAMLEGAVSQLHSILHKGGQLLTVFHTDEKLLEVPSYSFRIQGRNRVKLIGRDYRKPAQYFSTRSLEKLFRNFDQVKFFLTQDSLREVIVRK
ncbi:MAG: class I SAM-dependent methyltransferase [Bryobacterales bacterium]|nr:class I SAM-dependent methyltransferase [Bryobacterales bacterium]